VNWLSGLWQDVRHGARVFAKHPGFTAIAIVSIAFGTGANVAMFSLADALLLRPLPVPRPSELVTVGTRVKRGIVTLNVASYPDYLDIRERSTSFTGLIALTSGTVGLSTDAGASPHVKLVTMVNSDFFQLLGVTPAIGRSFLPEEERVPGRDAVAVLSHATWQQEYAADPSVIGRAVYIAGIEFTVVGVAPEGFTGLHPIVQEAAFVPLAMWPRVISLPHVDPLTARDFRNGQPLVEIVGIAKASAYGYFAEPPQDMVYFPFRQVPRGNMALLAQSTADSVSLVAPLRDMVRSLDAGVPVYDAQTIEMFYAARVTTIGTVMTRLVGGMGVMGVILTMVGLYGLVSYSVSRRTREIGIRVAIGATSGRVLRIILGQGLMPAAVGLLVGLVLSGATTRALSTLIPINQEYSPRTFFVVVPLLALVAVVASFVPARRASMVDPKVALRDE